MNVVFLKSFHRDLKKIKSQTLLDRVRQVIEEVETVTDLSSINNLKKLSGTTHFYRIRLGNYRIGISVEEETVEFVRILPRRNMYRFFP